MISYLCILFIKNSCFINDFDDFFKIFHDFSRFFMFYSKSIWFNILLHFIKNIFPESIYSKTTIKPKPITMINPSVFYFEKQTSKRIHTSVSKRTYWSFQFGNWTFSQNCKQSQLVRSIMANTGIQRKNIGLWLWWNCSKLLERHQLYW